MSDCLVVGGGVIGLSLAYELAGHGLKAHVLDAGQPGQEASWAGAGILPPAAETADDPHERLAALSNRLHAEWSKSLRAATGIDNGYRRSGAIYVARDADESHRLHQFATLAASRQIVVERLTPSALGALEGGLSPEVPCEAAYFVPDECQIRNPRHLKALVAACAARGVQITAGAAAEDFEIRGDHIRRVRTCLGWFAADCVCLTAGAWTGALAARLGAAPTIKPLRGQMVLLALPSRPLSHIINEGARYLVPRDDGRLLVGSTVEDAGFDHRTTAGAIGELLTFALSLAPQLTAAQIERTWAGLRPSTSDGLPYLGPAAGLDNAFIAAGHFRSGLQLSTGTAVVMSQLVRGQATSVELSAFRVDRDAAPISGRDEPSRGKRSRREVRLH